jgi:minor curlin subunit
MKTITAKILPVTLAALLAGLAGPLAAGTNVNTTIQEGRINTNDTYQRGALNDNATYQEGRDNANRTRQRGSENWNQTGQFGRINYNETDQRAFSDRGGKKRGRDRD